MLFVSEKMSDSIDNLPTDKNAPTHSEIEIVDTLFKEKQTTVQKLLEGTKDVLVLGFLFILFSLPQCDDIVYKFVPSAISSPYILVVVKAVAFMFIYFLIKNLYLVRKK